MTDILYVLKEDETGKYDDLRMSLRSIATNMHNVGDVYIIGAIPEWVNKNTVKCIPADDIHKRKHKNILEHICYAVKHTPIGKSNPHGMFMLASDDHWYMREVDAAWRGGPLRFKKMIVSGEELAKKEANKEKVGNYERSMAETRKLLEGQAMSCVDFSLHSNTWLSRDIITSKEFGRMVYMAQALTVYGCEPTCLVDNMIMTKHPEWIENGYVHFVDYKAGVEEIISNVGSEVEVKMRECISGSDKACGGKLLKWLEWMFKEKCKYES